MSTQETEIQGGIGSQVLLWVIAVAAVCVGLVLLKSSDDDAMGTLLIGLGGLSLLLALTVQAIRAALK